MSEQRKCFSLLTLVLIAIGVVAFVGWRVVTISVPPSLIFAASCLAVLPYVIAACVMTDCFTAIVPERVLPTRWRPMRKTVVQVAVFALLGALAADLPPALWVAIASSTAGACWMLGAHDTELEREEQDAALRTKRSL